MTDGPARAGGRPQWVTDLATIGRSLGPDHLVPLGPAALVDHAVAATGLDDFGAPTWREPFEVLCDAIAREAGLHTVGRLLTRSELLRVLENRLRVVDALRRDPAITAASLPRPVFITGTARSGTSILHELMAQDPARRAPAAWEVMYSVPPPEPQSYHDDPRIAAAHREVRLWDEIAPEYLTMHENGGHLPLECIFLTAHELASEHFSGVLDVPSYAAWMATADLRPAYAWHRGQLQLLQSRFGAVQWVLKAPSHLSALPALFAVYPDAWIVQTHRDPTQTVASTISLMATLRRMRADDVNVTGLAHVMAKGMARLLDHVDEMRDRGDVPDERIVDVRYDDLMRDPIAVVAGIYERTGTSLSAEAEASMRAYAEGKPRARHGAHRYSLADFGLDEQEMARRYAGYRARHGLDGHR